ncbi:unnamed protein product [Rotaria magnacalcarata]|uniref:Uncharacterized protein n=2 Tax=Rotaria magnacalcarata TaxID=392030 RepID=A0A816W2J2_9BILA|nr:unnamed protein product [Rotaria magnacalcarata]CAF3975935.1 unnamed protein product [Rotaria magnacalcarata]
MIKTTCLIENCIFPLSCADHTLCECTCDFVVRYIVTIEHEDNDDDELSSIHFSVIPKKTININQSILIGEIYSCFYGKRDIAIVCWIKPDRQTYFILLPFSITLVLTLIVVPVIYLIFTMKFTNPDTKQKRRIK